jgi:hypothetical protein
MRGGRWSIRRRSAEVDVLHHDLGRSCDFLPASVSRSQNSELMRPMTVTLLPLPTKRAAFSAVRPQSTSRIQSVPFLPSLP